ncbi:maltodextrose utilization protein MalA [Enterococcus sp. LJL99]
MSWFQLIFTYLFLTALLVIPTTLHLIQSKQYPVNQALPNMEFLLTDDAARSFQKLVVKNGQLETKDTLILSENGAMISGVDLSSNVIKNKRLSMVFYPEKWEIIDSTKEKPVTFTMGYSTQFDPKLVTDKESFNTFINEQFYLSNQASILLSISFTVGFFLFAMNLLLVLGAAFFLWLTRKSRFSTIHSFKESLNMVINSLGSGSIVAFLVGLVYFDIIVMVGIQSLFLVVMLMFSYVKTRFKGQLVEG